MAKLIKPLVKLIADRRMTYGTRRLQASDEFEATPADAKVLLLLKHVKEAPPRPKARIPSPPPALKQKVAAAVPAAVEPAEPSDEPASALSAAREAYTAKFGKRPYWGWTEDELKAKMAGEEPAL